MTTALDSDWRKILSEELGEAVRFDVPMHKEVAFRIGGPADALVRVKTLGELVRTLQIAKQYRVPTFFLGTGSNVLVSDRGIRGITIRLIGDFKAVKDLVCSEEGATLWAGAGILNSTLIAEAHDRGLVGLEFLATIPGTLGGALIMNAGAHGHEISEFLEQVSVLSTDFREVQKTPQECGFGYRTSAFGESDILLGARVMLLRGEPNLAKEELAQMRKKRRETQPVGFPNAGSIFKNPPQHFAGKLIEECGLKGTQIGGAEISTVHANFIVNRDRATARDVCELALLAQQKVFERFKVTLEWEVKQVGDWS